MTQQLATAKADGRYLDHGLSITFNGAHMTVSGRADSPKYACVWEFAAADVDLSKVADDYQAASAPIPAKPPAAFAVLDGAGFLGVVARALGFARADELLAASLTIQSLILKAAKIERSHGLTPMAIAYLQGLEKSPLTDVELASVDAVWAAITS